MKSRFTKSLGSAALMLCAAQFVFSTAIAQTQNVTQPRLTDAQAQALILAVQAQSQNSGNSVQLTPAQAQALALYLSQAQSAGSSAAGAPQTQALIQRFAAQGPRRVNAGALEAFPQAAGGPAATGTPALAGALGPKKPGVIRIGVATPAAQMGQGNSGANVAEPIRALITQYLSGPALEVTPITAMIPVQIQAEAKQKECDYIVYSSISQKTSSGGFGMLRKAMPIASMIPMVGMMSAAGGAVSGAMAASAAASAATSAASVAAGTVKAKGEVSFEYQLMAPGSPTPVLANAAKTRAKTDGEDVITPLIAQAATAIVTEVTRKK